MNWKPPESENEWAECLSAYLDGELPVEERRAVESHIESNPERATQLAELERTMAALREWDVDAPEPPQALWSHIEDVEREIGWREKPRPRGTAFPVRSLPWLLTAAVFLIGIFSGVLGTLLVLGPETPDITLPPQAHPGEDEMVLAETSPSISANQAEDLFREVTATGIKDDLVSKIRRRDWKGAWAVYKRLVRDYHDTTAVARLDEDRDVRFFKKLSPEPVGDRP